MPTGTRLERLGLGQIHRRYERSTGETVAVWAPINFYDDFLNTGVATMGQNWTETESTAAVTTPANVGGGVSRHLTTSANSDQNATIQSAERFNVGVLSSTKYAQVEARIRVSSASSFAGHQGFFGMMGTLPTVTGTGVWQEADDHCGFIFGDATETIADSLDVFISADDASTDTAAFDSGTDFSTLATTAVWKVYRIDFSDLTSVKFYIDGTQVGSATTVPFNGATEAVSSMAITCGLFKHTSEGDGLVATMDVDYVRYWSIR